MSIKIYNGTTITPAPTLKKLDLLLEQYSLTARRRCAVEIEWMNARRITALHDERLTGLDVGDAKRAIQDATRELHEKIVESMRSPYRSSGAYDYGYEITFIVATSRRLICNLYAQQSFYHGLWLAVPGVEEYGYWNNTDRPDHVTARQWARRAKDWALRANELPETMEARGFTKKIFGELDVAMVLFAGNVERLATHVPTLAERVRYIATELAIKELASTSTSTSAWDKLRERQAYVESETGNAQIEELSPAIEEALKNTDPLAPLKRDETLVQHAVNEGDGDDT